MKLSLFELLYGLSEALDHVESEWHPCRKSMRKRPPILQCGWASVRV